ncbi:MAG: YggT family protein [Propionivibrio sp.]
MIHLLFEAGFFLLKSLAEFLSILLLMRFFMQLFRASFSNQIGAFVVQLTNWLVLPLRRILPGVLGLDLSSLLPAYLLQVIVVFAALSLRPIPEILQPGSLAFLVLFGGLQGLLRTSIYLLIGLLILQAVLSWVNPASPIGRPIGQITDVFLRPIRRVVPPIANIDLSPLVAILLAQVVLIFV